MNSSEMFNREKKAAKLAAVLFKCGATTEDVMSATPEMWEMCAQAAGCHPPNSQETVRAVVEQLNLLRDEKFDLWQKDPKTAQQEADEAAAANEAEAAAEEKAEGQWLDAQMSESGADRCPPRE